MGWDEAKNSTTNAKRSKLAKLGAICVLLINVGVAPSLRAQSRWEVSLAAAAYNTHYKEEFFSKQFGSIQYPSGLPQDLDGNSLALPTMVPQITYRAHQDLGLPFFVRLGARLPVVTMKGTEVGHLFDTVTATVQTENVQHSELMLSGTVGWELTPFLQPFVTFSRLAFSSRRTGELDGTDTNTLVPYCDQDYTETATSYEIEVGIEGAVALNAMGDIALRYSFGYSIPQDVEVKNDLSCNDADWSTARSGQGTTGYAAAARVEVDLPLELIGRGYWSIGAIAEERHWNGDGEAWKPLGPWPVNTTVNLGGFIGLGTFF